MFAKKSRLIGACAVLATLALAASCTGFFVNPTITSVSVGPVNPTIEIGTANNTVQMHASGTNSDNQPVTNPSVTWTVSPPSGIATISSTGLVTSVGIGTATVTATSNRITTISGSQTVTVTVGCIQSISLDNTSGTITTNSPTFAIHATAATCNGTNDVTDVATWQSSNTSLATVSAGLVTMVAGNTTPGTVTITASVGNVVSNQATITVSP